MDSKLDKILNKRKNFLSKYGFIIVLIITITICLLLSMLSLGEESVLEEIWQYYFS